ncbi:MULTISPECIES: small acid-soluble spore protein Tlp [Paenibacillus]|uniref:Small acid-soluble spore protein (Thioredoxin-like protein) n=1 Tax=Paenibacillus barengoltzii J12 TaxID=935846 RepID=A0ABY1LU95_9BACL|nr:MULTISPECIES: small acid-soluble spore protein Tlp [Paenibacillus]MDU0329419.1 small acid-soluble spore protein Tlp [Paenibacillus sp. 3LSP]MEC2342707.1 small acid-soluble spore protein Tlp [Paenibacillus barengoltzii]SMF05192.1 small acid-soluble spore protein (thioredoxin-like protein) [Paenibacillus barengoltzii J12]SMF09742.1 small acid-soluble spore protein (thioredoxin-like protein) [Paenibacillus barengoltzii]
MAKPDNRSDNVRKIQRNIQNTIKNFREGQDYLSEHADEISPQEKQQIEEKNEKRLRAIEGFREEVKDEAAHQRNS